MAITTNRSVGVQLTCANEESAVNTQRPTLALAQAQTNQWGWLPVLTLVTSLGVLLIAFANFGALRTVRWAELFFWIGLLVLLIPTTMRLVAIEPSRQERIGLVVLFALAFYLVKFIHSPFAFTFADELLHFKNAQAIVQTHTLFTENSILPVSTFYPGLEISTVALVMLSGLSIFHAGILVIGAARLILLLALFLLVEKISRSSRVAGVAVAFYLCHSNFLFWSAQFSYESLSLPLALVVLFVAVSREAGQERKLSNGLTLLALLCIAAIVVTHHLTAYFLTMVLMLWALIQHFRLHSRLAKGIESVTLWVTHQGSRQGSRQPPSQLPAPPVMEQPALSKNPADLALFALVASLLWLFLVASLTFDYLEPVLRRAILSIIRLIIQEESGRQLFVSTSGYIAPLWERVIGIGAVLLSVLGLPFGLWSSWPRWRDQPIVLLLSGAAVAYFVLLGMRFTSAAWETANRGSTYLFLGLAFILALGIIDYWLPLRTRWWNRLAVAGYVAVLFMGGIIAGWPPTLRLTQPFMIAAGDNVFVPPGVTAAVWTRDTLGPGHRMVADETNGRYLLVYGEQAPLIGRFANISQILSAPAIDQWQVETLREWQIHYVLLDQRRISWNNMQGYFFDRTVNDRVPEEALFEPAAYEKFDQAQQVNRIFDSGHLAIYDVTALYDEPLVR